MDAVLQRSAVVDAEPVRQPPVPRRSVAYGQLVQHGVAAGRGGGAGSAPVEQGQCSLTVLPLYNQHDCSEMLTTKRKPPPMEGPATVLVIGLAGTAIGLLDAMPPAVAGTRSIMPATTRSGWVMAFVRMSALTVTPNWLAIWLRLSPGRTLYARPGASVAQGRRVPWDDQALAGPNIVRVGQPVRLYERLDAHAKIGGNPGKRVVRLHDIGAARRRVGDARQGKQDHEQGYCDEDAHRGHFILPQPQERTEALTAR